jgi:hypothetical protein
MLDHLLATLPLLLAGLVLGGMVFFAFMFAPLVFTKLPGDVAGGFIRQVFPVYYRAFGALSALAALSAWGQVEALVLAAVAAAFLFAWLWLMPRINAARNASPGNDASATRFGRLHRLSVAINAVQMIAVLVVFVRLAG